MIEQLRTAPNQLTLLRLLFIPFLIISITEERYDWALGLLVAAGISDGLDGLLARLMKQKTLLGQYLDPIIDKLLLSTLFPMLSLEHRIPWTVTVLVMSRDVLLLIVGAVLYITTSYREFKPNIWGKWNTVAQIATLFIVLVHANWPYERLSVQPILFWLTSLLAVLSGVTYVLRAARGLRTEPQSSV